MENLKKDEKLTALANNCPRCFCLLTFTQKYCPQTNTFIGQYKNVRIIVGTKEDIAAVKEILNKKITGSFEVNYREKVIVNKSYLKSKEIR